MSTSITQILNSIATAQGTNEKLSILEQNVDNKLLQRVIQFTYDPHKNFGISGKTFDDSIINTHDVNFVDVYINDDVMWDFLINALDECDKHVYRGSLAQQAVRNALNMYISKDMLNWIPKVLDRHLNCGISIKSFNSVWSNLIQTFECQLAEKFDPDTIVYHEYIAVEPKLDGTRIIAIVKRGIPMLYTRNGKVITNFDSTIGKELSMLCGDSSMVFDGELMSKDFSSTMGQLFRKKNNDISDSFYNIFDVMTLDEWTSRKPKMTCQESRALLEDFAIDIKCKYIKMIERHIIKPHDILEIHKKFREQGYEGTMVKMLNTKYQWRRDDNVMKLKDWYDFDLIIDGFVEGTGRYRGHLGSFVVKYEGTSVKVERGLLTKDEAKLIWENRSAYRGKCIEVQAQEVTKDGSLRFPKFIKFRPDKD